METLQVLKHVWEKKIPKEYQQGHLPNEATLEAAIYRHVSAQDPQIRVFAQIKDFMDNDVGCVPDLVIATPDPSGDFHQVDAVLELKNGFGGIEFDKKEIPHFLKLHRKVLASEGGVVEDSLELDPWTRKWKDRRACSSARYVITRQTAWVLAAIGHSEWAALYPDWVSDKVLAAGCTKEDLKHFWLFAGIVDAKCEKVNFTVTQLGEGYHDE